MKKTLVVFVCLLIAAIFISGCKEETKVVTPISGDGEKTATTAEEEEEAPAVSYELSSEERNKAETKLENEKAVLSTSYNKLKAGDTRVLALGIQNVNPIEMNFRYNIGFKDAMTTGGLSNKIDVDEDTLLSWFPERSDVFTLGVRESGIYPIAFTVGSEKAPGEKLEAGSYTFYIEVEFEESPRFWKIYEEDRPLIVVRIE